MPKLKTAAEDVPALVTVAEEPGDSVVVVPAAIVAAAPGAPFVPLVPLVPFVPLVPAVPCGMPKLRTAARFVPEFVTVAEEPAERVVVEPTVTVAAGPGVPSSTERTAGAVARTETDRVPVVSAIVTESVPRTSDEMEMGIGG
jgi:hypothetical protein